MIFEGIAGSRSISLPLKRKSFNVLQSLISRIFVSLKVVIDLIRI